MKVRDMKFSLKIVTQIVPIEQRGILEEFVDNNKEKLNISYYDANNEYDFKHENDNNTTHIYYNIFLSIPFKEVVKTLDLVIADMKSKDTVIKYIEIEDKLISTKEVQYKQ